MLRTRVVAMFLAIAVLCCGMVFSVSAEDDESCEISVVLNGSGCVTINGTQHSSDFRSSFLPGDSVTLTAQADEDYDFLFWINRENNRIVSWDATYTFTVATYALYEAVFDISESILASDDLHMVVYMTGGGSIIFMQAVELDDPTFINQISTTGMYVSGKTWRGWEKTAEEVASTAGRVYVRPVYDTDVFFTVTAILNGTSTTYNKQYLSMLTLDAPSQLNGQKFSYWIAHAKDINSENEIASFYSTYEFVVTGNVTLEAVYGETYDLGIAARIAGDFPSFNESAITISAEHSVTRNYTVMQHGMLITKDMQIGSFDDKFVINQNEPKIYKMTSNDTTLKGSFRVPISNWTAESSENGYDFFPRIYARAYVIARDKSGVTHTVYGQRYCVDYVYDTGTGSWTNYDDPFG